MKRNCSSIITLFLIMISLSACSSNNKAIKGKYISTLDNSLYYEFTDAGQYSTNVNSEIWDIFDYALSGTYNIANSKITLLADADENFTIELGYVYDKYICSLWSGKLPNSNFEETEISLNLIDSLRIDCSFNNDGTYKQQFPIMKLYILKTEYTQLVTMRLFAQANITYQQLL